MLGSSATFTKLHPWFSVGCNYSSMCIVYMDVITYAHYDDVIMGMMGSQITSLTIVYSTVYSDTDQIKHQSSASLAFVREFTGDR